MVTFVIAKYRENVDFAKKLNHNVVIYDKSDTPVNGSIKLKNVGREAETFLYHIVKNYDNLDEVTVFIQGNPFEHLQILVGWRSELTDEEKETVIHKMNTEITNKNSFTTFYQVLYNCPNGTNGQNTTADGMTYYGVYSHHFTTSPGAQYIVPKQNILARPLEFWKKLHSAMYNGELNAWSQEQLWYLAFTNTINNSIGDHDKEKARCLNSNPNLNTDPYQYFKQHNISL